MTKINCFVPFTSKKQVENTVKSLKESALVNEIVTLDAKKEPMALTSTMRKIAQNADCDYLLLYTE